ncbi:MAG: hypothetical protein ACRELY_04260 [Polyangiaceae bacterium]
MGIGLALACASCESSHATDDLKLKTGGYSAVGDAPMNPEDDAGAAPSNSAAAPSNSGALSGADYVEDTDSVLKDLRLALVACDSPQDPKSFVPGSETLALDIGPNGKVVAATPQSRQGLSDDIDLCLRRVAMGAEFAPYAGDKTMHLEVPVSFTRSALKRRH